MKAIKLSFNQLSAEIYENVICVYFMYLIGTFNITQRSTLVKARVTTHYLRLVRNLLLCVPFIHINIRSHRPDESKITFFMLNKIAI